MEFEPTGKTENPYALVFTPDEMEVVQAAFREYIFEQAQKGNTSSVTSYEAKIASWEDDGKLHAIYPTSYENVIGILEDFADRTDDILQRIPGESQTPAFKSYDLGDRFLLGRTALALVNDIREKAQEVYKIPESEEHVTDEALRDWLDN